MSVTAPQHSALINASGISPEVAAARGYRSITDPKQAVDLGFAPFQARPGLLVPILGAKGETVLYQLRPDQPRVLDGKAVKYETPHGARMRIDVPPAVAPVLCDPTVPLIVTEGVRKADAVVSQGGHCIALLGVWNWRGANEKGGKAPLSDWDQIETAGRQIDICYDSDVMRKPEVRRALDALTVFLECRGAIVRHIFLPDAPDGAKQGLDDFLAAGNTLDDVYALAQTPAGAEEPYTPAIRPLPEPLPEEAYHGLPGEIVRAIEPHTESDPAALLLQLLVGTGNLIGRTPTLMMDGAAHHPNLFAVLVGSTSKARKGTSWRQVRRLLAMVDATWAETCITGGLSSGEGLIEAVADPARDDAPPAEPSDKRLMVQVGEFASVLAVQGREGNTLSAVLRDAWDGDTLTVLNRKANRLRATAPHISMVAHVTRDELLRMLQTTEAANGYANRFLWGMVHRSKLLPRGGNLTDAILVPLAARLTDAVSNARGTHYVTLSEAAWDLWDIVYAELSKDEPGLLGAITARAEPLVLRLAMIYALMDGTGEIDVPHLEAGCAVWEYCRQSAAWIFGDRLGDPDGDLLLSNLRQRPEGVTRTEIHGLFGRNRSAAQINRALTSLEEKNLARRVEEVPNGDRSRRTERWFAVRPGGK